MRPDFFSQPLVCRLVRTSLILLVVGTAALADESAPSLADLLGVETSSASTRVSQEDTRRSPVGVSVLSGEEIRRSGATSIPDALRLFPGVLVREIVSGVYDVTIRGFDRITTSAGAPLPSNTSTLVMIDYHPVVDFLTGGTFWEGIALDLQDIDRIEMVRGPSASLYGPNAMMGVINIITSTTAGNDREEAVVDLQIGDDNAQIFQGAVGSSVSESLYLRGSVNHRRRERTADTFYSYNEGRQLPPEELTLTTNTDQLFDPDNTKFPLGSRSLQELGVLMQGKYDFSPASAFDVSLGYQESEVLDVAPNNFATPMATGELQTLRAQTSLTIDQFTTRASFTWQDLDQGDGLGFETTLTDIFSEYRIDLDDLVITPQVSYRGVDGNSETLSGAGTIDNFAASLLVDYFLNENLHVLGAFRADLYQQPEDMYGSYNIGLAYTPTFRDVLRLANSFAYKSPFLAGNYLSIAQRVGPAAVTALGNSSVGQTNVRSYEVGYRRLFGESTWLDIELTHSIARDFIDLESEGFSLNSEGFSQVFRFNNTETRATQWAGTVSLDYLPETEFVSMRIFFTMQESNYSSDAPLTAFDTSTKSFPSWFGGMDSTIALLERLRLAVNIFTTDAHRIIGLSQTEPSGRHFTVNTKLDFSIKDGIHTYVNVRNLLDDNTREYGFTDPLGRVIFFGIRLEL